jgi:myo-inositol-1(or 4)-monophosphatase
MVLSFSQLEIKAVLESVRRAGDFAFSHWIGGDEKRPFSSKEKQDGSPVTTVDLAVNELLISELSRIFPADAFYTEEAEPIGDFKKADGVWLIDPIDGTSNFINGEKDFGVLVARVENKGSLAGQATFGVAYFPAYQAFVWAAKGQGAYYNDVLLKVSDQAILLPERVYVRNGKLSDKRYHYKENIGTAHGFFYLCSAKVDGIVVYIRQHQEWDIGPWVPIIIESGGKISDQQGSPILFNFSLPKYTALVASAPKVHSSLVQLVKK